MSTTQMPFTDDVLAQREYERLRAAEDQAPDASTPAETTDPDTRVRYLPGKEKIEVTLTIDKEIIDRLQEFADAEERPLDAFVNRSLWLWIRIIEQRINDKYPSLKGTKCLTR